MKTIDPRVDRRTSGGHLVAGHRVDRVGERPLECEADRADRRRRSVDPGGVTEVVDPNGVADIVHDPPRVESQGERLVEERPQEREPHQQAQDAEHPL
jgi:hypothetical protein